MRPLKKADLAVFVVAALSAFGVDQGAHAQEAAPPASQPQASEDRAPRFPGMDQSVNVDLAEKAGVPARAPFLNVEEWGELWNLILLLGGGVCGFVIGRYWNHLWGRPR